MGGPLRRLYESPFLLAVSSKLRVRGSGSGRVRRGNIVLVLGCLCMVELSIAI